MELPHQLKGGVLAFVLAGALAFSSGAHAVPAAPGTHTLTQPDGTTIQAQQWGDEWNHGWETLDRYTIVKDDSGAWVYAERAADGSLEPSNRPAHMAPPASTPERVRPAGAMAQAIDQQRQQAQKAVETRVVPSNGTAQAPVILINFSDTSTTHFPSDFESLLFGSNPAVATGPGSMKDFYEEVSYGNFSVTGVAEGWYTADNGHDYYGQNDADGNDQNPGELVKEAVQAADDAIDFSKYDNDGDGVVETVIIVHQGSGEEAGGSSTDIWSHHWTLNSAGVGSVDLDGVTVNDYVIQPETQFGHMATMGVFAHEYGHALGLPDLYDTDGSSEGIGDWGLMSGGSWNQVTNAGDSPAHAVAWSKDYLGWASPSKVKKKLKDESVASAHGTGDFYLCADNPGGVDWEFGTSSGSGEYFLVENRQKSGFDQGLPGAGLLVTQIAEYVSSGNDANQNEGGARLVDVKEADGNNDLDNGSNRGDQGDLFTSGDTFDKTTSPAAVRYDGGASTFALSSVSASGAPMTATLDCGADVGFTIDDTGSMGTEIGSVKSALKTYITFLESVLDPADYPTIAMHTFKDSVELDEQSNDMSVMTTAVDNLTASSGGGCPEWSLSALYQNAGKLREGAPILFATDASNNSSDPVTPSQLASRLSANGQRVLAFLTGDCGDGSFAVNDPVRTSGSRNPGGGDSDPFKAPADNTLDTYTKVAGATGGSLVLIPEAKSDTTARTQLENMVSGVMKASEEPSVISVKPKAIPQGATLSVTITGANTDFGGDLSVSVSGDGVSASEVVPVSSTKARATLSVASDAARDLREVTVESDLGGGTVETASSDPILRVQAPSGTPEITGVDPSEAPPDSTVDVAVYGLDTSFDSSSTLDMGSGVTVNSVSAKSSTELEANITLDGSASIGTRDVVVTTGSEVADESMVGPFTVTSTAIAGLPKVTAISKDSGYRTKSYDLDVTGENTSFDSSTTAYFTGGSGLGVTGVSVSDATHATVSVDVAKDADLGYQNLTLETGDETASLVDAFQVVAAAPEADFAVSTTSPGVDETVDFTDKSSDIDGSVTSWAWDFDGDGTTDSSDQNPSHSYSSEGTYTAELTVTDDEGDTGSATTSIDVTSGGTSGGGGGGSGGGCTLGPRSSGFDPVLVLLVGLAGLFLARNRRRINP